MPAVTEWPRPNGLPIATTQSPTRVLSLSPHFVAGSGFLFGGSTLSSATSTRLSEPISLALSCVSSRRMHRDVLGALDHVVVGDDVALAVDDEARAQRRAAALLLVAAALVEELLEQLLEGRAGRQLGHVAKTRTLLRHVLRRGDVDHRRHQNYRPCWRSFAAHRARPPADPARDPTRLPLRLQRYAQHLETAENHSRPPTASSGLLGRTAGAVRSSLVLYDGPMWRKLEARRADYCTYISAI